MTITTTTTPLKFIYLVPEWNFFYSDSITHFKEHEKKPKTNMTARDGDINHTLIGWYGWCWGQLLFRMGIVAGLMLPSSSWPYWRLYTHKSTTMRWSMYTCGLCLNNSLLRWLEITIDSLLKNFLSWQVWFKTSWSSIQVYTKWNDIKPFLIYLTIGVLIEPSNHLEVDNLDQTKGGKNCSFKTDQN